MSEAERVEVIGGAQERITLAQEPESRITVLHEPPAPSPVIVEVVRGPRGPQGIQGDPGPRGLPGAVTANRPELAFSFEEPALEWLLHHGQGRRPPVIVLDTAGDPILALALYPDADNALLRFDAPVAGTAYIS